MLIVSLMSITGGNPADCTPHNRFASATIYTCTETLIKSGQGSLSWAASSSGLAEIQFQPQQGTLGPDQLKQRVTITVTVAILPRPTCPTTSDPAYLFFTNETNPTNIVPPVPWSC
jgi:hypothetical protein